MVRLDSEQLDRARRKLRLLNQTVKIRLNPGQDTSGAFVDELRQVARQIAAEAPDRITLEEIDPLEAGAHPGLELHNVTYRALPVEHQLDPFLEILCLQDPKPADRSKAPEPDEPARIQIFVARSCPNCPAAVEACARAASGRDWINLEIIDAMSFPELAGTMRSVPTIVIDGTHSIVGATTAAELLHILAHRGADHLSDALLSMIEAGRLQEAVPVLCSEDGPAALVEILKQSTLQQRMGLMLVVELALDENPHGLDHAVPHLTPLIESDDATLRGDTADLLGQIGAPGASEALTRLLADENPDVQELARDSLDMLRKPS